MLLRYLTLLCSCPAFATWVEPEVTEAMAWNPNPLMELELAQPAECGNLERRLLFACDAGFGFKLVNLLSAWLMAVPVGKFVALANRPPYMFDLECALPAAGAGMDAAGSGSGSSSGSGRSGNAGGSGTGRGYGWQCVFDFPAAHFCHISEPVDLGDVDMWETDDFVMPREWMSQMWDTVPHREVFLARSAALRYLWGRMHSDLRREVSFLKQGAVQRLGGPDARYLGLHLRRGDKVWAGEMEPHEAVEYLAAAANACGPSRRRRRRRLRAAEESTGTADGSRSRSRSGADSGGVDEERSADGKDAQEEGKGRSLAGVSSRRNETVSLGFQTGQWKAPAPRNRGCGRFNGIYVASDDYRAAADVAHAARTLFPDIPAERIFSMREPWHSQADPEELSHEQLSNELLVALFADFELLAEADMFVGTYSSHVGNVVAMLRQNNGHAQETAISLDDEWEPVPEP